MIAQITPQNSQQPNLLAAALNGNTSSLSQALNNAIQRSQQDVELQSQQGAAFLSVQAQRLARQQEERFDLRNRAENTRDFNQRQNNDSVINDGRRQNQVIQQENQDHIRGQRNFALGSGTSPAQLAATKEQERVKNNDFLRKQGADPTTLAVEKAQFNRDQQEIAESTNTTPADNVARTQVQNQQDRDLELPQREAEADAQNSSNEAVRRSILSLTDEDFDAASDEKLIAAIQNIDNSDLAKEPQAVQMRSRIVGILQDRGVSLGSSRDGGGLLPDKKVKPLTSSEQGQLDNARLDVEDLQSQLDSGDLELDEERKARLKINKLEAQISRLSGRQGGDNSSGQVTQSALGFLQSAPN